MRLSEVEKKARSIGIKDTCKLSKKDLIKMIQRAEGNSDCFAAAGSSCAETSCCWRPDCLG